MMYVFSNDEGKLAAVFYVDDHCTSPFVMYAYKYASENVSHVATFDITDPYLAAS